MVMSYSDWGSSLGIIAAGLAVSIRVGYEWLQRNKVERRKNESEVRDIDLKDHASEAYERLIDKALEQLHSAEQRVEAERKRADTFERRSDEIYQQSRQDREQDRKEIEVLSRKVHELSLKVNKLTNENSQLKNEVSCLSLTIGGQQKHGRADTI